MSFYNHNENYMNLALENGISIIKNYGNKYIFLNF